jgi:uncharacterized protein (UPF0276 family)
MARSATWQGFVVDDEDWAIRYIEVLTRNWWPGKKVADFARVDSKGELDAVEGLCRPLSGRDQNSPGVL